MSASPLQTKIDAKVKMNRESSSLNRSIKNRKGMPIAIPNSKDPPISVAEVVIRLLACMAVPLNSTLLIFENTA